MRPLRARRPRPIKDPAPSKWGYRMQRLMLTPGFVHCIRVGTPLALIAVIAGVWFGNPDNRKMLEVRVAEAKAAVQQRPEFMVSEMIVTGADAAIEAEVRDLLPVAFPISSFDLELEGMRQTVAGLNAVAEARVKVGDAGALLIDVTPRVPVALWRSDGTLKLIDSDGVFSGVITARSDRRDLPLIAGDGAQDHIEEALALFQTAAPIQDRVRGLVRMGERRWDMVLDRNQRLLLPENAPKQAVDRVLALHAAQDLLDRDIAVVDLRNTNRATIQLSSEAATALRRVNDTGTEQE